MRAKKLQRALTLIVSNPVEVIQLITASLGTLLIRVIICTAKRFRYVPSAGEADNRPVAAAKSGHNSFPVKVHAATLGAVKLNPALGAQVEFC